MFVAEILRGIGGGRLGAISPNADTGGRTIAAGGGTTGSAFGMTVADRFRGMTGVPDVVEDGTADEEAMPSIGPPTLLDEPSAVDLFDGEPMLGVAAEGTVVSDCTIGFSD